MTDKLTPDEALADEAGFTEWASPQTGVHGVLWERYLKLRTGAKASVGIDWVAIEGKHKMGERAWMSWEKHPKWYKAWCRAHAGGKYGTRKEWAAEGLAT